MKTLSIAKYESLNRTYLTLGLTALAIAWVFYELFRSSSWSLFGLGFYSADWPQFVIWSYGSLPSFLHVLTFSFLSLSIINDHTRTTINALYIGLFWTLVGIFYEYLSVTQNGQALGQLFSLNSFIAVFDLHDVLAVCLGFLVFLAIVILIETKK